MGSNSQPLVVKLRYLSSCLCYPFYFHRVLINCYHTLLSKITCHFVSFHIAHVWFEPMANGSSGDLADHFISTMFLLCFQNPTTRWSKRTAPPPLPSTKTFSTTKTSTNSTKISKISKSKNTETFFRRKKKSSGQLQSDFLVVVVGEIFFGKDQQPQFSSI